VGEVVENTAEVIREALEQQPDDGRNVTSSRNFKGASKTAAGLWTRVGTTGRPQKERVAVYERHGCHPTEVTKGQHSPAFSRVYDVDELPLDETREMDDLSDELGLKGDQVEADEFGFAVPRAVPRLGAN
jgi:hypothetical protein